ARVAPSCVRKRVVLVHGLAGSPRWWSLVDPSLHEYDVAYGDPRRPLEVEPEDVLVGHSLGGFRAAQFATTHPVRKLVLVAPVGLPRISPLGLVGSTTPRHYTGIVLDSLRWGPRGLLRGGLEATRANLDPSPISAPTLVVWGERDRLVPARLARRWQAAIPGARLAMIPRARHVP